MVGTRSHVVRIDPVFSRLDGDIDSWRLKSSGMVCIQAIPKASKAIYPLGQG